MTADGLRQCVWCVSPASNLFRREAHSHSHSHSDSTINSIYVYIYSYIQLRFWRTMKRGRSKRLAAGFWSSALALHTGWESSWTRMLFMNLAAYRVYVYTYVYIYMCLCLLRPQVSLWLAFNVRPVHWAITICCIEAEQRRTQHSHLHAATTHPSKLPVQRCACVSIVNSAPMEFCALINIWIEIYKKKLFRTLCSLFIFCSLCCCCCLHI